MPKFFNEYGPDIPDKLLINIFSYLDNRSLTLTIPAVSKSWQSIVNAHSFNENKLGCILKRTGLPIFKINDNTVLITSGYTNENYKITLDKNCYILRIPIMKDHVLINRHYEKFNTDTACQLGLGAEVIYYEYSTGIMLTKYIVNRCTLTNDILTNRDLLTQITYALKMLHGSSKGFLGNWFIFNKIKKLYDFIIHYSAIINKEILEELFNKILLIESLFDNLTIPLYPCHNDLSPNNFLLTNEGIKIIDWEFSGNNDKLWDLAFLSVVSEFDNEQEDYLLDSYFDKKVEAIDFCRFVLYKPIAYFWIGLLSLLQIYNCNSRLGKTWLTQIAVDKFNISRNMFSEHAYLDAYSTLQEIIETNNKNCLTMK
jgi:thiamine kinase-like enzyme